MEIIKQYHIIQELNRYNENLTLWLTEDNSGQFFEVLTIKENAENKSLINRLLKNEIRPLVNEEFTGIQKIVDVGFDDSINCHYITYEHREGFMPINHPNFKNLLLILKGLDQLKKQNRFGYYISEETIIINENDSLLRFVGLFELFKQQNLLSQDMLALEVRNGTRPNAQSDMFAVFKCFEDKLDKNENTTLMDVFKKALSEERTNRFAKYSDVFDQLNKIDLSQELQTTDQTTIKIVVAQGEQEDFLPTLNEMNISCYFLVEPKLSKDKGQITGLFSTENYSGRFFVDPERYLFIDVKSLRNEPSQKTIQQGFKTKYQFSYHPSVEFNCNQYFKEYWIQNNKLTELSSTKEDLLEKWHTLPEKEKEYIEEKAFKANYVAREESKSNKTNVIFQLVDKFRDWDKIKELKREDVNLSVDDRVIGKVQDYNPTDCSLIIKDPKITLDEIPETGELIQDVRMETSQFKKQVEACKKFENQDVVNTELCGILATPERVPRPSRIDIDYDSFMDEVINPNIKTDDTQRDAVLEALHHKPVYLMQGPPGTGKTTVIVELIQQIIKRNSHAKILVTSQSNLAVDNVLERLPENVLFMRLAATEDRISDQMKKHSFQSKLNHWADETQQKSEAYFATHYQHKSKDKALENFYNAYANLKKKGAVEFRQFTDLLRVQNQYIKNLFEHTNNITQVESIFNDKLGKEFQQLKSIQKDWFAFLANAELDERDHRKSMLNDGSGEIDLQTAFVKSVDVIGATCIHIASGQYSNINFRFDYVIMDESSKATPAESLVPINMGQNIILIGDHKQLPPVVTREDAVKQKVKDKLDDNGLDFDKEFGESLFEKLFVEFEQNPNLQNSLKMLDIQYRMPRQVGDLISRHFYNGKLKNADINLIPDFDKDRAHGLSFKKPTVSIFDTFQNKRIEVPNSIVFVSTSNREKPQDNDNKFDRKNETNKKVIEEVLDQLNGYYPNNSSNDKPLTIGIIAGYRGQVNLLKDGIDLSKYKNFNKKNEAGKSVPLIEINTVDKFQGGERDIIIYDIVKSSKGKSNIGFLDDYRRINVAFSRVKKLLIVVGDSEYLLKRATLNPHSKFEDFKLKEIAEELSKQGAIVHNLNEIIQ